MERIEKRLGVVIKKSDYKENGHLITMLTPDGKETYIVRGSKKISSVTRNYVNLLTKMNFNCTTNMKLNTLTEASIITTYLNIQEDIDKLNVAMVILEKVNFFGEEITNHKLLYDFVCLILDTLNSTQYPYILLSLFEIKLLYLLGVSPELNKCVLCGNKEELRFSINNGGMICSNHFSITPDLTNNEVAAMKLLYFVKPDKINEELLKLTSEYYLSISKVIDAFYLKYLEFNSKAKKIINQIN